MSSTQNQTNIHTISKNDSLLDPIINSENFRKEFNFSKSTKYTKKAIEEIGTKNPDCILLDFDENSGDTLKLIDSISVKYPNLPIIVAIENNQLSISNEIVLAGARAFLMKPLQFERFFETLERVLELSGRRKDNNSESIGIENLENEAASIVVFSPKGGAGTSSVSINVALGLVESLEKEILLIDGKMLFGHLDLMLNLYSVNTISDLIPHVGALDEILIRDVLSTHSSGLQLLPSPNTVIAGQGIQPEIIAALLRDLKDVFPFSVIDGGNYLNDNVVTYMDLSDIILLVVNPEITSLRDASQFLEICKTLNYPKEKIQIIVNKFDTKNGLSISDIEKSLQRKMLGTVPIDYKLSQQSINHGVPLTIWKSKNPLSKGYINIAANLLEILNKTTSLRAKVSPTSDALSNSSRLG